jgi:TRAP-type C4-dicarboxylate transport system permease small subunit
LRLLRAVSGGRLVARFAHLFLGLGPRYDGEVESLKKVNHWLYQAERVIVVVSLLVMSVVVFLSVVYRRYADPESVLASKLAGLIGVERETAAWQSLQDAGGPLSFVLLAVVVYLGFRTASRRALWNRDGEVGKSLDEIHGEPLPHLKCAIYSVATLLGCWALMVLLFGTGKIEQAECIELHLAGDSSFHCGMFPAGLAWAQPLGLIFTLWVAFLGASMATKENLHLKVEAVQKALPEHLKRISGLLSGLLTAGFCMLLAYLAYAWVDSMKDQWVSSNHLGGLHDGIDIPKWLSFSIVPLAYVLMGLRFVGIGVLAFRGELEELPAELRELKAREEAEAAAAAQAAAVVKPVESGPPPDPDDPPYDTNDEDEEDGR